MIIPDYQLQSLRTQGYAQYRVPTSDAPCADDFVQVDGRECRVLMVVHDGDGWSKVCVTIDRR